MVTRSKLLLGSGRCSALASTNSTLPTRPSSISRSRPRLSMASLMSDTTTLPSGPTRRASLAARSPVPAARSRQCMPRLTWARLMACIFHSRCRPRDIRSFIRSYLPATERNTSPTRRTFSPVGTFSKPKSVVSLLFMAVSWIVRRPALDAGLRQLVEVALPVLLLMGAEFVEIIPRIEAGGVAVVEHQLDGVVADRADVDDVDVLLAGLQHPLPGTVTTHLGRRRIDAQVLAGQPEHLAALEVYFEDARFSVQLDLGGRHPLVRASGRAIEQEGVAARPAGQQRAAASPVAPVPAGLPALRGRCAHRFTEYTGSGLRCGPDRPAPRRHRRHRW